MPPDERSDQTSHLAALLLVIASAVTGVFGCALGAIEWGILGLAVGLVGSWLLFLAGLVSLFRREQRLEQVAVPSPTPVVESIEAHSQFS